MKEKLQEKIKYIILIFLIIIFIISIVPKEFQNDTFFTIAIGEKNLENGVQTKEQLVWHNNLEFTNPRWLFDVIVTLIYNKFGFIGIHIGTIIVATFQALLYFYFLKKITNKKVLSFLATIIIMYFCKNEFTARAQIISFTLFLLEYYCLDCFIKTKKKRYFVILAIIPILLVNIHASVFPMYFVIYLPYIAEFILNKIKIFKKDEKISIENINISILPIIILLIVSVLLSFVTPKSLHPYTYMFKNMGGFSKEFIDELQPIVPLNDVRFSSLVIFAIGVIAFTKVKINVKDILYIIGFLLMSLLAIRCKYFFYLISYICIIRILNDFINEYNIKLDIFNTKLKKLLCCMFVILFLSSCLKNILLILSKDYVDTQMCPVYATEYILNNIDLNTMKIYNHFNFGSYLEFKGIKAFIDSRSEVYTKEFNSETTILSDWFNIANGTINYNEIFEKYGITHALLYNNEIINTYIKYDEKYKLIYQDDIFSLYEKLDSEK